MTLSRLFAVAVLASTAACSNPLTPTASPSGTVIITSPSPTFLAVRDANGTLVSAPTTVDSSGWSASFAIPQRISVQFGACAPIAIDIRASISFVLDPATCTKTP